MLNAPPVLHSLHENHSTIQIGERGVTVGVTAVDVDPVEFQWTLSEDGFVGDAVPVSDKSQQVFLGWDPELDGQELQCVVSDAVNPVVTYDWILEVLP